MFGVCMGHQCIGQASLTVSGYALALLAWLAWGLSTIHAAAGVRRPGRASPLWRDAWQVVTCLPHRRGRAGGKHSAAKLHCFDSAQFQQLASCLSAGPVRSGLQIQESTLAGQQLIQQEYGHTCLAWKDTELCFAAGLAKPLPGSAVSQPRDRARLVPSRAGGDCLDRGRHHHGRKASATASCAGESSCPCDRRGLPQLALLRAPNLPGMCVLGACCTALICISTLKSCSHQLVCSVRHKGNCDQLAGRL